MAEFAQAVAIYGFVAPRPRRVEKAGISYECNIVRDRIALGLGKGPTGGGSLSKSSSTDSSSVDLSQENAEQFMDKDDEKYYKYVAKLDPNDFKDQDHYKVLGLSKMRFRATMGQIKTAYRQKVLIYHPDKGKATKNGSRNETIFSCIQKAYEQIGLDVDKRRSYDSVDPKFDESMPDPILVNATNFYDLLGPVFERNSRFSVAQPVPPFGNPESSREDVETFYDFWFHFKSWREFSYLDEEDKSKGEDRWERREIEKMNRVEREQRRKKYLKKLSSTIEMAYEKDPRVAYFKECDKKFKQDQKDRKRQEKQRLIDERQAKERLEQEKLEAERQKALEIEKQQKLEKQQAKKILQAGRKRLRDLVQSRQYFSDENSKRMEVMEGLERVCLNANIDEITYITDELENVNELADALEFLSLKKIDPAKLDSVKVKQPPPQSLSAPKVVVWEQDEISLLIKATNLYPAGSVERWTQVTKYINDHSKAGSANPKVEKDIIKQVKALKSNEASNVLQSKNTYVAPTPTENVEEQVNDESWTALQQRQLETALKLTNVKDSERWEKIAKAVEGKTKKQCVKRYKELAQMIKNGKK